MDATTYELRAVLGNERRFIVPTFQRDYEWTRDEQWALLFDDLISAAGRLAAARARADQDGDTYAKAEQRVAPHFLGAIVLDQLPSRVGEIDQRAVIDGQQRLTTIQLLLRALADVLAEQGANLDAPVKRMLFNPIDEPGTTSETRYKLWPRRKDREVWKLVMDDDATLAPGDHLYSKARRYFTERIRSAIAPSGDAQGYPDSAGALDLAFSSQQIDLGTLVDAARVLFKLVVIDLHENDDAQVIFEVLNGRQTPLSAADLVKNLLFLRAEVANEAELDSLHDTYWAPLETRWWREGVGRGHATRQRREVLLSNWLSAQTKDEANISHLYSEIRSYLAGRKVREVLGELADYAAAFQRVVEPDGVSSPRVKLAYDSLNRLGITSALPLLLWLETRPLSRLTRQAHETAIAAIESWVVRRLITKRNTRGYGAAFLGVLSAAAKVEGDGGSSAEIAQAVVRRLAEQHLDWPSDADIISAFATESFYGYHSQERIRFLLGSIDEQIASERPKSEQQVVAYEALQIEHLLPQGWRGEPAWNVGQDPLAIETRDRAIHRIGNLTLLTEALNPALSNGRWALKRAEIARHSVLQLNRDYVSREVWNEEAIEERGRELASYALRRWPGPDGFKPMLQYVGLAVSLTEWLTRPGR